ncbi:MAG: hypothetical protein KGI89_14005 [Euryarchaeota archaeon]|nr:hypothetical protein [Euryarchaeota archaeon]
MRRPPIPEALAMILCAAGYLLLLTGFMLVVGAVQLLNGTAIVPDRLMEVRDLVALFGWVGLTISGVSTIVVPNHVGVPLAPRLLPRLHLLMSNVGILGFFALALIAPASPLGTVFLLVAVASFFIFGANLVRVLLPFLLPGGMSARPSQRKRPATPT